LLVGALLLGGLGSGGAIARPNGPGTSSFPGGVGSLVFDSNLASGDNIFRMEADGSIVTKLTETNKDTDATWSADATQLLFVSNRDTNREIYRMNASGNHEFRLTNNPNSDFAPA